ncbi:hypothetical protein LWF15_27115 [Kineosporia rhizophila]|uniref:hypothetical protein n=1 Tax=Kineosporia TaxID=49184 RepID=UPI001E285D9B|nr:MULTISPECIES: hypothetical protein [Kineosporia]MCE0539177.1 hypothetical protein [Kineosporia rhizophila]GLY18059.1 hypothetical protein Kisp01_50730 [Kineosporia sp. NBRC 101677]
MNPTETAGDPAGVTPAWSLLLPSAWSRVRLRTDRREQVQALVARAFATVSRDQAGEVRRSLEKDLLGMAEKAFRNGGRELYLLSEVRRGLPLAASCVVSVHPEPLPADVSPEILAQSLAGGSSEAAVILVDGEPTAAVRRSEAKVFQAALPELEPPRLKFTGLDVYAPFPDRSQLLLLSFRTPVEPIADSMMILFEAIAGSLRWQEA